MKFLLSTIGFTLLFFFFGLQNISQFETVDEHFWKYDRIPAYWEAWKSGNLKKTAVNDKPGITVAFFGGAGLLFVDLLEHRIRDPLLTNNGDLTLYKSDQTTSINTALRIPGLVVNALLILLLAYLSFQVFASRSISLALTIGITSSPILLGITQIANPDTYLWSFSFAAFLSWVWYLQKPSWKKSLLTGILLGGVVLSKYTGLILLPIFFGLIFLLGHPEAKKLKQYFFGFFLTILVAVVTLVIFLPAVLVKQNLFWKSTLGFFAEQGVLLPLGVCIFLCFFGVWIFPKYAALSTSFLQKTLIQNARLLFSFLFFLFAATFIFGIGNQSFVPLEQHYLSSKEDEKLAFPLISDEVPAIAALGIKILTQIYPLLFSLHPFVLIAIFFFFVRILLGSATVLKQPKNLLLTLFSASFIILFVLVNLKAGVLINARYGIILFPFFYMLAAFGAVDFFNWIKEKATERITFFVKIILGIAVVILFVNTCQNKPFLFNYTSPLLEKQFIIHDAWGYGLYEAATYLNNLSTQDGDPIYVWSDRNGICQFLKPSIQCVSGFKIDRKKYPVQYVVISKRGIERGYKPYWQKESDSEKSQQILDYPTILKDEHWVWRLNILERPDNFIMVVPVPQNENSPTP